MQPEIGFWEVIILLGALQGAFLALVCFRHPRGNVLANRMLGLLILAFSLRLLEIVAYWTKYLLVFPHFWATTNALPYLFGPFLFFYVSFQLEKNREYSPRLVLHLIPYILHFALMVPFYLMSAAQKVFILENYTYGDAIPDYDVPIIYWLMFVLQFPHVFIYILLTAKKLRVVQNDSQAFGNLKDATRVRWLQGLTIGFGIIFSLWVGYNLSLSYGVAYSRIIDYGVTYAMTIWIYAIGYFALRHPEILSGAVNRQMGPKYEKSNLTESQADEFYEQLLSMMASEKPFLEPTLKLPELAARLNIPAHHLSRIINERCELNFFDFINRYRVEAAKKKLSDPAAANFTLLAIAFEVGFNNKTSFNSAFRKFTGMTPSEFRKTVAA